MTEAPLHWTMLPKHTGKQNVPTHIGMVGVGSIGTALCYRQLFRLASETLAPNQHPELSIHNLPLAGYLDAVHRNDWHTVASMLRRSSDLLASIGAELCFTPDNMVQHALPMVMHSSRVPWVNMAEVVSAAVASSGHQRVAIIGTPIVTSGSTYQTHLGVRGVRVYRPSAEDADRIGRIVLSELANGFLSDRSHAELTEIVSRMRDDGCDAVLFGTSEAPLLTERGGWSLPTFDSCEIVAAEALRLATQSRD
ncbi:MAG: hypothetical protein Kow0022_02530 [Phycisphaerales bacterium]